MRMKSSICKNNNKIISRNYNLKAVDIIFLAHSCETKVSQAFQQS